MLCCSQLVTDHHVTCNFAGYKCVLITTDSIHTGYSALQSPDRGEPFDGIQPTEGGGLDVVDRRRAVPSEEPHFASFVTTVIIHLDVQLLVRQTLDPLQVAKGHRRESSITGIYVQRSLEQTKTPNDDRSFPIVRITRNLQKQGRQQCCRAVYPLIYAPPFSVLLRTMFFSLKESA